MIGHDWGCLAAWNTALLHPDTCTAVMGLSVPVWRVGPEIVDPPGADGKFWYIRLFQTPGRAEPDLESDLEKSLVGIYCALASDSSPPASWVNQVAHPEDRSFHDVFPMPEKLPVWLTAEDVEVYLGEYRKSGFRGPNNWYRNMPVNNSLTPELETARFTQPAAFAAGADDDVLLMVPDWQETFAPAFDDLRFCEIVEGAGHWIQMEKPSETNELILRFLKSL